MIEIINYTQRELDLEKFKNTVEKILKELKVEQKKVFLYLIGPSRMRKLNKKFRKKNRITTVLSFCWPKEFVSPPNEEALGEIFLCPAYIKKLAKRENLDFWEYFIRITIHGILHLLGYRHKSPEESKIFEAKETEILKKVLKS